MKTFSVRTLTLVLALSVSVVVHAEDKPQDIVDTAVAAGSFKTLVAAVKAADLVETLKGKGPFTVFAPTDEAFAKLPVETREQEEARCHSDLPRRLRKSHGERRRQVVRSKDGARLISENRCERW